jgi:hypothetical protein
MTGGERLEISRILEPDLNRVDVGSEAQANSGLARFACRYEPYRPLAVSLAAPAKASPAFGREPAGFYRRAQQMHVKPEGFDELLPPGSAWHIETVRLPQWNQLCAPHRKGVRRQGNVGWRARYA